jgi:hypothetical protein
VTELAFAVVMLGLFNVVTALRVSRLEKTIRLLYRERRAPPIPGWFN